MYANVVEPLFVYRGQEVFESFVQLFPLCPPFVLLGRILDRWALSDCFIRLQLEKIN